MHIYYLASRGQRTHLHKIRRRRMNFTLTKKSNNNMWKHVSVSSNLAA